MRHHLLTGSKNRSRIITLILKTIFITCIIFIKLAHAEAPTKYYLANTKYHLSVVDAFADAIKEANQSIDNISCNGVDYGPSQSPWKLDFIYPKGSYNHPAAQFYAFSTPTPCSNGLSTRVTTGSNVYEYYKCHNSPLYTSIPRECGDLLPGKEGDPQGGGPCPSVTHPISIALGTKWLVITDYLNSNSKFNFTMVLNSSSLYQNESTAASWAHRYIAKIVDNTYEGYIYVSRTNGILVKFTLSNTLWLPDADITDKLTELKDANGVRTGWTSTVDATGEVETYNAQGLLLSIKDRAGNIQSMSYSTASTPASIALSPDLLIQVTNHLGQSLKFTYDNANRIKTMTNPQGGVTTYTYSTDGNNNLSSVTYPDGKTKTYHYGEADYVSATPNSGIDNTHLLTGITDENGNRYATYYYDAAGRAYSEYLAGGADAASLAYNTDANGNPTTTVVTDARGSNRTYSFETILGVVKMTGQSQPAGSGCNASTFAMSYDANGNVASRTDFNGNKTTYVYDMTRNLETSRTEGLTSTGAATPATRTITTTYHATWRLPLVISEYTGASATGTPLKRTTYVYDANGNITMLNCAEY